MVTRTRTTRTTRWISIHRPALAGKKFSREDVLAPIPCLKVSARLVQPNWSLLTTNNYIHLLSTPLLPKAEDERSLFCSTVSATGWARTESCGRCGGGRSRSTPCGCTRGGDDQVGGGTLTVTRSHLATAGHKSQLVTPSNESRYSALSPPNTTMFQVQHKARSSLPSRINITVILEILYFTEFE